MYICFAFFRIAFKNAFVYRTSVFLGLFGAIFSIIAQTALWSFVFRENEEMIKFMIAYVIISRLIGIIYTDNISYMVGDRVTSGDFVIDLIKPANPIITFWSTSVGTIMANMMIKGVPLIIFFFPILSRIELNTIILMQFICTCVLGFILINLMYMLVGYIAFIVLEIWPFVRLLNDTIRLLSGAIIPITFFPYWLQDLSRLMPFQFLYHLPIRILLEGISGAEVMENLTIMLVWIIAFIIALKIVYNLAIRRSIVQGG